MEAPIEEVFGYFTVAERMAEWQGVEAKLDPRPGGLWWCRYADGAVARGEFHVYPIETIDQGIECLTGVAAGERDAEGRLAEGTINHKVEARLGDFAEKLRAFASREAPEGQSQPEGKSQRRASRSET